MTEKLSLRLIGAGSMGGSLALSWLSRGLLDPARSAVIDPAPSQEVAEACAVAGVAVNPLEDGPVDICVLAVKPQQFASILPGLDWPGIGRTLFISVAAGTSLDTIRTHLMPAGAAEAPVIRAMPNLPVRVGEGMTLLLAGETVSPEQRAAAEMLMTAAGKAVWVESEAEIDMGTALSGSGPAYVFLLTEAMAEAGVAAGLSPATAVALARQTVIGGGALLAAEHHPAEELRKAVTSPGGTTEAALSVLDRSNGIRPLMREAIAAAVKRAGELSR